MKVRLAVLVALVMAACAPAATRDAPPRAAERVPQATPQAVRQATTAFRALHDGFLEWYYEADPVRASELGIHTHDSRFAAMDRSAVQRRIDALLDWEGQLRRIPIRLMRDGDRYDYAVVEFAIRGELLELEEIRRWAVDPRIYTDMIARGLATVADLEYAPADRRAEALRARLAAAPDVLAAARANVRNPPRIWTELAITHAQLLLEYVEDELPARAPGTADAAGGASAAGGATAADGARAQLATALREHIGWLEDTLLPASTGDFRLGQYFFARKLLYNEHLDLSLTELERLNQSAIADYQAQIEAVAEEIGPGRSPIQILDSLADLRPDTEELVGTVRAVMLEARDRVIEAELVSIPPDRVPVVRESPAYARQQPTSLQAPGPFDPPGTEGFVNVTNVDPAGSPARQREHLAYFNEAVLPALVVHETFPGRYVQQLRRGNAPSDARRVFAPRALTSGWAHYAEQMMFDEGFRQEDPVARLGQLHRALQGHARWDAALQLHAHGVGMDAVVRRFMEIAHVPESHARGDVLRVTYDPLSFADALGRMQILELRRIVQEYLEEKDEVFTLRSFHDQFLDLGLPLSLASEELTEAPAPEPEPDRRPVRLRQP